MSIHEAALIFELFGGTFVIDGDSMTATVYTHNGAVYSRDLTEGRDDD